MSDVGWNVNALPNTHVQLVPQMSDWGELWTVC